MSATPGARRYTAEEADFVRERGTKLGYQSQALWKEFNAKFPSISYTQLRNFGTAVKSGIWQGQHAAAVPTIETLSAREQERLRAEGERKLFHELRSQKALTDALLDAMTKALPTVPFAKVPVLKAPARGSSGQTAIQLLSDLHVGNKVDREETGGLGEYSYPIFKQRLARLQDAMRSITAHHRASHPVPRLVMPWLGDMIENIDIFASQLELVDLDLMAQVLYCIEDLSEFTVGLLDTYESIFIPVVTGNHGRLGRKGQHKRSINWDYLIGKVVQSKLAPYADRITFEVPKAAFAVVEIEGYSWLLRHGDGIKSWGGIPFYGINRSVGRWTAIQASQRQFFDYMAMGHFHTPTTLTYTGGEVIINGCFPGPTEFSVEVIETLNRPMQFFGMMHPKFGLAARYPILLDPRHA